MLARFSSGMWIGLFANAALAGDSSGQSDTHGGPPVSAEERWAWLPESDSPLDLEGNRPSFTAPTAGQLRRQAVSGSPEEPTRDGLPSWAPFGPSGADAESIAASPTVAGLVIAGLTSAVGGGAIYRSTNAGSSWTTTTGTGTAAVREVEFSISGVAWAATDAGLFRSIDSGQTWSQVLLPVSPALVRDVATDPTDAQVVWIGLGQFLDGGSSVVILRTTNGGTDWTDVSPPISAGMGATVVAIDPSDPQHVYAGFTPNFGGSNELWVTGDSGANWSERSGTLPNVPINDVAFSSGLVLLAGGQDFGSQFLGLYVTADDGLTWSEVSIGWPSRAGTSIAVDPNDLTNILVGTTRAGVARTTDGGENWTFGAGGTGTYQVNSIDAAPAMASTIYLGMGSVAVFKSSDGGANFTPSSNGISRLEITSFASNPTNRNEIAAAYSGVNDGGVFLSEDGGQTWFLSQAPLPRWQSVYFAPNGTLYGTHNGPLGRADDGLWKRNPDGTWSNLGPGSPSQLDTIGLKIAASTGASPIVLWGGYRWLPTTSRPTQIWSYNRAGTNAWELEHEGAVHNEQVQALLWLSGGAGASALAGIVNFGSGAGRILRSDDSGDTWAASESGYLAGWNAWSLSSGRPQDDGVVYLASTPNTSQTPGSVFMSLDYGQNWVQQGTYPVMRYLLGDPVLAGTVYGLSPFSNARPQRSIDDGMSFSAYDTGFISTAGGRDVAYGGQVGNARRLYVATSQGGFATVLPPGLPCPSDLNFDGRVNLPDAELFAQCMGGPDAFPDKGCPPVTAGRADNDFDGDSDLADFAAFQIDFGQTCP